MEQRKIWEVFSVLKSKECTEEVTLKRVVFYKQKKKKKRFRACWIMQWNSISKRMQKETREKNYWKFSYIVEHITKVLEDFSSGKDLI